MRKDKQHIEPLLESDISRNNVDDTQGININLEKYGLAANPIRIDNWKNNKIISSSRGVENAKYSLKKASEI